MFKNMGAGFAFVNAAVWDKPRFASDRVLIVEAVAGADFRVPAAIKWLCESTV
jgi:hypothetical protein